MTGRNVDAVAQNDGPSTQKPRRLADHAKQPPTCAGRSHDRAWSTCPSRRTRATSVIGRGLQPRHFFRGVYQDIGSHRNGTHRPLQTGDLLETAAMRAEGFGFDHQKVHIGLRGMVAPGQGTKQDDPLRLRHFDNGLNHGGQVGFNGGHISCSPKGALGDCMEHAFLILNEIQGIDFSSKLDVGHIGDTLARLGPPHSADLPQDFNNTPKKESPSCWIPPSKISRRSDIHPYKTFCACSLNAVHATF